MAESHHNDEREPIGRFEIAAIALITLIGAVVRAVFMVRAPGFYYDEAIYALDGLRVLREPGWPIFFDTLNHMREPLYIYLLAGTQWLLGPSVMVARGTATLVGVITIPVVWALAREWRGPLFALFAGIIFATLRWHVHFSGLCFRTITSPLMAALVALFFLRLYRTRSLGDAIGLGLSLGIGAYSYLSFRLFPFIMLPPMMIACIGAGRTLDRAMSKRMGQAVLIAAVVFAPLGIHFVRNPDHFSGRSDEVSIFSRPGLILSQARDVALMPLLRGDHVGKHNIPGPPRFAQLTEPKPEVTAELWALERDGARMSGVPPMDQHGTGLPIFFPLAGLMFYAGLALTLWKSRRDPRDLLMITWLLVGSLASVLSFGAPNMLRLLYLSPLAALLLTEGLRLCAAGFSRLALRVGDSSEPPRAATWLANLLTVGILGPVLALHLLVEGHRAWQWPTHPMVPVEFNTDLADLGAYLASQPDRLPVRLPAVLADHPTLRYVADGYAINPPVAEVKDKWWEFEASLGMEPPPAIPSRPAPDGRTHVMRLPNGVVVGTLVEVTSP